MPHVNLPPASALTIRQMAEFCGLLHDLGKLTRRFQQKLRNKLDKGDSLRDAISHEWISAWLVAHMLNQQSVSWEGFLSAWDAWEQTGIQQMKEQAHLWRPFSAQNGLVSSCLLIIATHHRLFSLDARPVNGRRSCTPPDATEIAPAQHHVTTLPTTQDLAIWRRVEKWDSAPEKVRWQSLFFRASELLNAMQASPAFSTAHWHKSSLVARAAMVLADHHVSSRVFAQMPDAKLYPKVQAYANAGKSLNQPLTWHLAQVAQTAERYVQSFAASDLPALSHKTRRDLHGKSAAPSSRFIWQSKACDFVHQMRENTLGDHAFLIFNVASTGAGKTRANVRILESCRNTSDPLRITAGFNLKTLTLQTALVYRQELQLSSEECACIVGDALARALHLHEQQDDEGAKAPEHFNSTGCDSDTFLRALPAWLHEMTRRSDSQDSLTAAHVRHSSSQATLIAAPVLVCTMDYLVAAGDPSEQAHHAHALLRIAHSDLLIDEADSYDPEGLIAVLRVVQMAGMFGRNVLVSSATLSPVLATQIQRAWQSGMCMHQAGSKEKLQVHEVIVSNLGHQNGLQSLRPDAESFTAWYQTTLAQIYAAPLATYRLAQVVAVDADTALTTGTPSTFSAPGIADICMAAHANHHWPASLSGQEVRISVGVLRMANVRPLQKLAEALSNHAWPEGVAINICAYHAQDVAMRRYFKEQTLDSVLKRHGSPDVSQHPLLQALCAGLPVGTRQVLLLVLASPVEEVGRDHDFDWAVIEPSSMHSIVQLAGRVNRHRLLTISQPNVFILENNFRKLSGEAWCFTRPGLQQNNSRSESSVAEPITHLPSNASNLLLPAASQKVFPLDASLIFSSSQRCHFAEEDERAIEILLKDALPFFDEHHEQWGCDWLYRRYPLRTRDSQQTWRATPSFNGKLVLHLYEQTSQGYKWVEKNTSQETRPPNEATQWLCPSLHEADKHIQQHLGSLGLTPSRTDELLNASRQFTVRCGPPEIHWQGIYPSLGAASRCAW